MRKYNRVATFLLSIILCPSIILWRIPSLKVYAEDGLEYVFNYDQTVTIIDYDGDATEVNIPAEIDGCLVTEIGNKAFEKCRNLTNVYIPSSVTSIGNYAFSGCSSLNNINIPEGMTSIERGVFEGCSSLTNIDIPKSITKIGSFAFSLCFQLKNLVIPENVTSIEEDAFLTYNLTLWCYSNSYAEQYAKDNGFTYNGYPGGYRIIDKMESYFDWITLSQEEYVYDGTAKTPAASIEGLTQGTDFDVSYSNNTNAGTGTVTLTGKGEYSGTVTKDFIINEIEINENEKTVQLSEDTYEYDGTEKQPEVTINGLMNQQDYEVTYENNINAGTATAKVTGKGNYRGVLTKTFTITSKDISVYEKEVQLSQNPYYSGRLIVTIEGLEEGRDYTVIEVDTQNSNIVKVKITGIGNYAGRIEVNFEIKSTATPTP